jgi:hypothetical protein
MQVRLFERQEAVHSEIINGRQFSGPLTERQGYIHRTSLPHWLTDERINFINSEDVQQVVAAVSTEIDYYRRRFIVKPSSLEKSGMGLFIAPNHALNSFDGMEQKLYDRLRQRNKAGLPLQIDAKDHNNNNNNNNENKNNDDDDNSCSLYLAAAGDERVDLGLGVFSNVFIKKGRIVTAYGGVRRDKSDFAQSKEKSHSISTGDPSIVQDGRLMAKLWKHAVHVAGIDLSKERQKQAIHRSHITSTLLDQLHLDNEVRRLIIDTGCGFMINHSERPNCSFDTVVVEIDGVKYNVRVVVADEDIDANVELSVCYDNNESRSGSFSILSQFIDNNNNNNNMNISSTVPARLPKERSNLPSYYWLYRLPSLLHYREPVIRRGDYFLNFPGIWYYEEEASTLREQGRLISNSFFSLPCVCLMMGAQSLFLLLWIVTSECWLHSLTILLLVQISIDYHGIFNRLARLSLTVYGVTMISKWVTILISLGKSTVESKYSSLCVRLPICFIVMRCSCPMVPTIGNHRLKMSMSGLS